MLLLHSPQGRTWFLLYGLPITNIPLNSPSRKFDNFNYHVVGARGVENTWNICDIHSSVKRNNKKERRGRRKYSGGTVCVSIAIAEGLGGGGSPSTNTRARVPLGRHSTKRFIVRLYDRKLAIPCLAHGYAITNTTSLFQVR